MKDVMDLTDNARKKPSFLMHASVLSGGHDMIERGLLLSNKSSAIIFFASLSGPKKENEALLRWLGGKTGSVAVLRSSC